MSQQNQPNFNYNYARPPIQNPQVNVQSPQMQQPQNSPPPNTLYQQQQLLMNQMRYNPQMMYQMMRGQIQMPGVPPNFNQQMMQQMQMNPQMQQMPQMNQMQPQMNQMQPHMTMNAQQMAVQQQMAQQMQQQQQGGRFSSNYSARMPFQIQQYQQPYKKTNASYVRQSASNLVNVKPSFLEHKKPVVPPPKPNNSPGHIPTAKQVGIKLLQPISNEDSSMRYKKTSLQANRLLKDELIVLFRSMDRKRSFFKFTAEFDAMLDTRLKGLQLYYEKQKIQISSQIDKHSILSRDIAQHHTQYNISQQKIVKDIKDVGYKAIIAIDKEYLNKKRASRLLPCRWIGLHERPNFGRRMRLPLILTSTPYKTNLSSFNLCPLRLNIDMDGLAIADTFTWDINSTIITPECFAMALIEDFKYPMHKDVIDKIIDQITSGIEEYMIASHTPDTETSNDLRIRIKINLTIGFVSLEDEFEWDLLGNNSPEEFAEVLATELHLGGEFMYL